MEGGLNSVSIGDTFDAIDKQQDARSVKNKVNHQRATGHNLVSDITRLHKLAVDTNRMTIGDLQSRLLQLYQ